MKYFVFLEFLDPKVQVFLTNLRTALYPRAPTSPVHITLRGPYDSYPESELLTELSAKLVGHGVRIQGSGLFQTPNGFAIYLRAESAIFQPLWWKPDFPTESAMPPAHLTVFESINRSEAEAVLNLLKNSQISILTYSIALSIYTSKQTSLFGSAVVQKTENRDNNRELFNVDLNILEKAKILSQSFA